MLTRSLEDLGTIKTPLKNLVALTQLPIGIEGAFWGYLIVLAPLAHHYFPSFTIALGFLLLVAFFWRFPKIPMERPEIFFALWVVALLFSSFLGWTPTESLFFTGKQWFFFAFFLFGKNSKPIPESTLQFLIFLSLAGLFLDCGLTYAEGLSNPESWSDDRFNPHLNRISGPFSNPNLLGGFLAGILGLSFFLTEIPQGQPLLKGIFSLFSVLLLTLTHSRGALLSFSLGFSTLLLWKNTEKKRVLGLLLLSFLIVLAGGGLTRFASLKGGEERGMGQRLIYYKASLAAFFDNPTFGCGPGSFSEFFPKYRSGSGFYTFYAHNEILQNLGETGLVGTLLFFLFLAAAFSLPLRGREGTLSNLQGGALLLCLIWFFDNQISFSFRIFPFGLLFFTLLGSLAQKIPRQPVFHLNSLFLLPFLTLYAVGQLMEFEASERFHLALNSNLPQKTEVDSAMALAPWNHQFIALNPFTPDSIKLNLFKEKPFRFPYLRLWVQKTLAQGDFTTPVSLLSQALSFDPYNEEIRFYLLLCQGNTGKIREGFQNIQFQLDHFPMDHLKISPFLPLFLKSAAQFLEKNPEIPGLESPLLEKYLEKCRKLIHQSDPK